MSSGSGEKPVVDDDRAHSGEETDKPIADLEIESALEVFDEVLSFIERLESGE